MVLGLLEAWEHNQFVVNNYKGEVFASGAGIWIDYRVNPDGHRLLFDIMDHIDGERAVADIAMAVDASFQSVWQVISLLEKSGLAWLSRVPTPTSPRR